jgi:protein O-GlcNAc transferase
VLWLLEAGAEAESNLRREAASAGIKPERLIFAPHVAIGQHVARNATADLFLDTYPHGAHAVANDALLAGLPLVTCAGETLASRVTGSQLSAVGLADLITTSLDDYEKLARRLATEPGLLASYRQRLATNRHTMSLFDMARYARDFEAAMHHVWNKYTAPRPD